MTTLANNSGVWTPHEVGPALQWVIPAVTLNLAASIPASGNVSSAVIPSYGWQKLAVGLQSTQAGQLTVQRYLDDAGTIVQSAALTAPLTANTAAVVNITDGVPFRSFKVTVSNTGASAAAVSGVAALLQSA